MFCYHCGSQLPENALFCPTCGAGVKEKREDKPKNNVKANSDPTPAAASAKNANRKKTVNISEQSTPPIDNDTLYAIRQTIKREMESRGVTSMRVIELGKLLQGMTPPFDCKKHGYKNLTDFFTSLPDVFTVSRAKNVSLVEPLPEEQPTTQPDNRRAQNLSNPIEPPAKAITPPDEATITSLCRAMYYRMKKVESDSLLLAQAGDLFGQMPIHFSVKAHGYRNLTQFFESCPEYFVLHDRGVSLTKKIRAEIEGGPAKSNHTASDKTAMAIETQQAQQTSKNDPPESTGNDHRNSTETIKPIQRRGEPFFTYKLGDYAYMRIMTNIDKATDKTIVTLVGIDGVSSAKMPYYMFASYEPNAKTGDFVWVCLTEIKQEKDGDSLYKVYFIRDNDKKHNFAQQSRTFVEHHGVGDRLIVPINELTDNYISVFLTPDCQATLNRNLSEIRQYISDNGAFLPVEIEEIVTVPEKTLFKVQLSFLGPNIAGPLPDVITASTYHIKQTRNNVLDALPGSMREVSIPPRILSEYIDDGIAEQICKVTGETKLTETGFRNFLDARYQEAKQKRRLRYGTRKKDKNDPDSASVYSFELDLDDIRTVPDRTKICSNGGAPITACFKKSKDRDSWVLNLLGTSNAGQYFEHHVRISRWSDVLDELSDLALDECWDLPTSPTPKIILKRYLQYTYYKCWIDGHLMDSIILDPSDVGRSPYRMFNTGLVDNKYDDIFCVLERIDPTTDSRGREWAFKCFGVRNGGGNSKRIINSYFDFTKYENESKPIKYIKPLHYKYKTTVNNEEKELELVIDDYRPLIFNPDLKINMDNDHICLDNVARLPMEFLEITAAIDPTICSLFSKYKAAKEHAANVNSKDAQYAARKAFRAYKKALSENELVYRHMFTLLQNAIDDAKKQCRWNYKTAIPIYYPRNNGLSLLLPIKLQKKSDISADVALVVQQLTSNSYQGETILTMEMAFQNARQICRPNSEWLTVENVGKTTTSASEADDDDDE